ncbi:MAG: FAD-binding protein [Verrucomicrobiae bacterium]|nr:FAD-binding protein [Verrucomicrobiae bacterium]
MKIQDDVIVVGCGPAGMAAAIAEARKLGRCFVERPSSIVKKESYGLTI